MTAKATRAAQRHEAKALQRATWNGSKAAERAARRHQAAAPQRASWEDIAEDSFDDDANEAATAALLAALVIAYPAGVLGTQLEQRV
jgi:hypothetical protein